VIGKLTKHLGSLRGKSIALLGLAFKPNTNDMREAPSLIIAPRLLSEGAEVRGWDPVALEEAGAVMRGVDLRPSILEAVAGADAAIIVTEWDELRDLASPVVREAMRRPLIVDGRNLLDPESVRSAGFVYESVGRASSDLHALPEIEDAEPELQI
jgi:UDPglucose 6-dehydrogenase